MKNYLRNYSKILSRNPVGVKVLVSLDDFTYTEVQHSGRWKTGQDRRIETFYKPGSVPGEISLESSQTLRYVRLVMIEDQTDPDLGSKPIGVRLIEMVGCPGEETMEACREKSPRLATDGKAYRHIG